MSQNDFNVANQGFPATRADINSALQALASNSSGATEPSTTYSYQWWYDTANDILKMRNGANDGWIDFAEFDQAADTWQILIGGAAVTASAAELNILDGVTATTAELNILDGVTATAAELNQLDGDSTAALKVPVGTEAQRPTPAKGMFRFNDDGDVFEGYDGTAWGEIGGGANFSSVAEDIIPDADSTRDLGSSTVAWALAYLDAIEPVGADTTIKRVGGTNTTPIVEGIAKAWVNFNGTGTIAARDSLNLSSLTDNGGGDYSLNWTNAFDAADYAATSAADNSGGGNPFILRTLDGTTARTGGAIRVQSLNSGFATTDAGIVQSVFHGDLA